MATTQDGITTINVTGEELEDSVSKKHEHSNKTVLDKLSVSNGKLQYDSKNVNENQDLTDYYKKTETYNQEEVDNKINNLTNLKYEIVTVLPSENISETTVYLIETSENSRIYIQYLYENGDWSQLSGGNLDLSKYVLKSELSTVATSGNYDDIINKPTVPVKVSELINDSNFIDNTVNNLINYYKKTETYTQDEINELIGSMNHLDTDIVTELPSQNISTTTIYLIETSTGSNIYTQYMYIKNSWANIGNTQIDLSGYVTKESLTTHTNNSNIHVTYEDKTKWDKVTNKVEKSNILTSMSSADTNDKIYGAKLMYYKLTELLNRHVYVHHITYYNVKIRYFFVTIINNNKNAMTVQDFVDYLKSIPNTKIQASGGVIYNGEGECSSVTHIYYSPSQDKIHMRGNRTAVLYDSNTGKMSLSTSRCTNPDWGNSLTVDEFISSYTDLTDSVVQVI